MLKRTAGAVWEGSLKDGKGTMNVGSGAFDGPYTFASRFERRQRNKSGRTPGCGSRWVLFHGALARLGEGRVCTTAYQHEGDCSPGY